MKDQCLSVNGLKIAFCEAGQGQPLLFLHGLGFKPKVYQATIYELSKKFRVIAPALLGHGQSDFIPVHFKFDNFAEVMGGFIEQFSLNNIILVGHSLGGAVALHISYKKPEIIKQLFLIDPIGLKIDRPKEQWQKLLMRKTIINLQYPHGYQQIIHFLRDVSGRFNDFKLAARLTTNLDLENMLQYIKVPTYLLFGEKDVFFPKEYAHWFAGKIPHSHLEIIKKQGHDWCLNRPKLFKEVLEKYVYTD